MANTEIKADLWRENFAVCLAEFRCLLSGNVFYWVQRGILTLISEEVRRDPYVVIKLSHIRISRAAVSPFVALQQLAEVADEQGRVPRNLREVITAGEQLRITPPIARMIERLKDCALYNQYGPTESHVVTASTLSDPPDQWPTLPSVGHPIANTQIYI